MLVVASGKGGTGTSLVSALLALAVAGEGQRVLLVDGTEHFGALHHMLGVRPRHPLSALRDGAVEMASLFTPVAETLALFPGGGDELDAVAPLDAAERETIFARLRELYAGFDLVVVDAGSRLEAVLTACGGGVTRLVLVAGDDQIALAATHALLKAVTARLGSVAAEVVVNRCAGEGAAELFAPLAEAAERFLDRRLELAGAIPHDPCLQGGLGAGMALQDAAAGSPCALAARLIGLRLVNTPESRAARGGGRLLAWPA